MSQITHQHDLQRRLRTARAIGGAALSGAVIAAVAGLALAVTGPSGGTGIEAALGIAAASGGILAAAATVFAAIYAQVHNLWRHFPLWVRVAAWGVIAYAVLTMLWTLPTL